MTSRLFLVFLATALPLLVAAAWLLERIASRALEAELGRRVESLAVTVAASIPATSWQQLFTLGPGEEESRTANHLRSLLRAVRDGTSSEWLAVWTIDGRVMLDTDTRLLIGSKAPQAEFLSEELAACAEGRPASTRLFRSISRRWVKIGVAPFQADASDSRATGVLIVQAPSSTLAVVAAMRRTMIGLGIAALILVAGAAWIVARAFTRRIRTLVASAERIGNGDLESTVPALGRDEIGVLAGALDSMRSGVQVRDRQLRAMVGGVAHEIRNPLGGLVLFAELLARDSALNAEQAARARRILSETERLGRVVAEFLAFARPESPRGRSVALKTLLPEVLESSSGAVKWRGDSEITGDADVSVWCDPDHLRQILQNLLQNAMQAAPGGTVRIAIGTYPGGTEIAIEDSGCGVPECDGARIFEPFFTTRPAGAGLGLAIVKRLCDLNSITIGVGAGQALGGARFALRFPARAGD